MRVYMADAARAYLAEAGLDRPALVNRVDGGFTSGLFGLLQTGPATGDSLRPRAA